MNEPLKIKTPPTPGQQLVLDTLAHEVAVLSGLEAMSFTLPVNSGPWCYNANVIRLTRHRITALELAVMKLEAARS